MQKPRFLTVDLTKAIGNGEFRCPKCGIKISPDDMTEDTYTILDSVMKDGSVDEVILRCNKCGSQLRLTGFHLLNGTK